MGKFALSFIIHEIIYICRRFVTNTCHTNPSFGARGLLHQVRRDVYADVPFYTFSEIFLFTCWIENAKSRLKNSCTASHSVSMWTADADTVNVQFSRFFVWNLSLLNNHSDVCETTRWRFYAKYAKICGIIYLRIKFSFHKRVLD